MFFNEWKPLDVFTQQPPTFYIFGFTLAEDLKNPFRFAASFKPVPLGIPVIVATFPGNLCALSKDFNTLIL